DIRVAERWMGREELYIDESVASSKQKLERSIASKRQIKAGEIITEDDIHMLSPGDGFKWADRNLVIGKTAKKDIPANEIIYKDFFN
ncbi:MAG: shikimate dehydrogenase, partial [Muribaculaceae bacterium]|nr:shikimate dehydrogenase [Muribaculaceae bacterium]